MQHYIIRHNAVFHTSDVLFKENSASAIWILRLVKLLFP